MSKIGTFYSASLGKKAVMAVSGILLFGFVLVHMLGNLKMYLGAESFNRYAAWLREIGYPALPHGGVLNLARAALLVAVVVHIWAAWQVSRQSRAARQHRYLKTARVQADYATRTMRWGGVIILLFVIYHLLHLTWGTVHPDFEHPTTLADGSMVSNAYHNVVRGFEDKWVSLFYIVANVALAFHLYHGLWSLFQTLGWNHPKLNPWRRRLATAFAFVVTAGNISFPIAVLAGIVR
jgi:succinate dehydrogenase / fumarate reductase cytochrome b subunit